MEIKIMVLTTRCLQIIPLAKNKPFGCNELQNN
jgi:hypothetical protein